MKDAAADPDGDVLTYAAASSNVGIASVSVSGSDVAVTSMAAGSATVTVTATDPGGLSARQSFTVTVPNRTPEAVGEIGGVEVLVDGVAELDVAAYFTDPDGDELVYAAASADTIRAMVSMSGSMLTVTGVAAGSATVTVTATDPGGLSARQSFTVTVPNRTPEAVGEIGDVELAVGDSTTFDLRQHFSDPDGDPLAYAAETSNDGIATVSVAGASLTVRALAEGSTTANVTATDLGGLAAAQSFDIRVVARARGERDAFAYWDASENGDLTCSEARDKDEGLRLPAYSDNRDGTGLIYDWLQRGRSSDSDGDGIACDSESNPNGYVPVPPRPASRVCPSGSPTWMGLPICEEGERTGYNRDAFGSAYSSLEDEIIAGLPKSGGQVYTPYSCKLFDILPDGTADTDIEHIVALAEAYDSGLHESEFRTFAGDLANLTIADPSVNRHQKSDRDAAEWRPPQNTGWFAAKVVAVKQKYDLSVNPAERDALASMLESDSSRTVRCN